MTDREAAPFRITICGLHELAARGAGDATHVVSILDPGWPDPPELKTHGSHRRVKLYFHDVIEPLPGAILPERWDVDLLLAFGRDAIDYREHATGSHPLIHCHAGVSRSTAAAILILAQRNADRPADEAVFGNGQAASPRLAEFAHTGTRRCGAWLQRRNRQGCRRLLPGRSGSRTRVGCGNDRERTGSRGDDSRPRLAGAAQGRRRRRNRCRRGAAIPLIEHFQHDEPVMIGIDHDTVRASEAAVGGGGDIFHRDRVIDIPADHIELASLDRRRRCRNDRRKRLVGSSSRCPPVGGPATGRSDRRAAERKSWTPMRTSRAIPRGSWRAAASM